VPKYTSVDDSANARSDLLHASPTAIATIVMQIAILIAERFNLNP
jgi:hypothetical protein